MGKRAFWAGAAKIAVCLGVLNLVGVLIRTAFPQIAEATSIALMGDPRLPSYSIKLPNNASEVEISGGIKFGLTNDLERILNATTGVRTVHLDSIGGRVGEGQKLNAVIRSRGLDTYVEAKCMSACTLAFVAGRQRILKKGAQLGFHRAAFAGEDRFDDSAERSIYRAAGISGSFIDRALATENASLWKPSEAELLSAGVVTRISTGDEYAFAGVGGKVTRDEWDKALKTGPAYRSLKENYPKTYDEILEIFTSGAAKGIPRAELMGQARAKISILIRELLPFVDDAVLIDFAKLVTDEYLAIQAQDRVACYKYASGQQDQTVVRLIPDHLTERELELSARIIGAAKNRYDVADNKESWDKIRAGLSLRGYAVDDLDLLNGRSIESADYARYCDLTIALYQEITGLPTREAAAVLREFFS